MSGATVRLDDLLLGCPACVTADACLLCRGGLQGVHLAQLQVPACFVPAELKRLPGTNKHRYHGGHEMLSPYVWWGGAALR